MRESGGDSERRTENRAQKAEGKTSREHKALCAFFLALSLVCSTVSLRAHIGVGVGIGIFSVCVSACFWRGTFFC